MRTLYSFLIYLLTPLVLLHLLFRGLRSSDYLKRWPERFAFFEPPGKTGGIVVHAVSMGEVNAASSLIRELAQALSRISALPDHLDPHRLGPGTRTIRRDGFSCLCTARSAGRGKALF